MSRSEEARLIYSLLNAAEEEDRLLGSAALERWLVLKLSFDEKRAERAHSALFALFEDLARKDIFVGTWIEVRWLKAKSQRSPETGVRRKARGVTHK